MPFRRRVVVLPPGARRRYRPQDWRDCLVLVARGQIRLEHPEQPPDRFRQGDLLWLFGLGLRAIHNPGPGTAVLAATSRQPRPRTPRRTPP